KSNCVRTPIVLMKAGQTIAQGQVTSLLPAQSYIWRILNPNHGIILDASMDQYNFSYATYAIRGDRITTKSRYTGRSAEFPSFRADGFVHTSSGIYGPQGKVRTCSASYRDLNSSQCGPWSVGILQQSRPPALRVEDVRTGKGWSISLKTPKVRYACVSLNGRYLVTIEETPLSPTANAMKSAYARLYWLRRVSDAIVDGRIAVYERPGKLRGQLSLTDMCQRLAIPGHAQLLLAGPDHLFIGPDGQLLVLTCGKQSQLLVFH
ncbi:MAG TPA: hypothetical protein VGM23_07335, partial [Armatimonadota bacterium]